MLVNDVESAVDMRRYGTSVVKILVARAQPTNIQVD